MAASLVGELVQAEESEQVNGGFKGKKRASTGGNASQANTGNAGQAKPEPIKLSGGKLMSSISGGLKYGKEEQVKSKSKKLGIDTETIDQAMYDKYYNDAMSLKGSSDVPAESAIRFGLGQHRILLKETKKNLDETLQNRPGAKATIAKLQKDLTKFVSTTKAMEQALADREKKTSTSNSGEQASQEKPAKTDTTEKKEEKKLRPVGTGTNGPERRRTQNKESENATDAFKLESKNGFKFKSNSDYRMRYNKREKAYEIWKEGDIYGIKTAMMSIKSDDENIGGDIIKHIQKKYPKTGSTISYSSVTYGF